MALRKGLYMESLRKDSSLRDIKKPKSESTERLTLQKPEQKKLDRWVNELNQKFDGMIKLTKSDLANFLIRHHAEQLTDGEIAKIEGENFDELRWMTWALNKIRQAKKEGQSLTLAELMAKRNLKATSSSKVPHRKDSNQPTNNINLIDSTSSTKSKTYEEAKES